MQRIHGNVFESKDSAMSLWTTRRQMEACPPSVQGRPLLPFTSRVPSIVSVVDLIRQGRCTMLNALQQRQIMMLECTISAYTLAALSLAGARV